MAVHTILIKVAVVSAPVSAPSRQAPRRPSSACEVSTSSFLPFIQSRFLSSRQSNLQINFPEARNKKSPGRCWAIGAMAGQLSLLSSAEIADQNERLKDAAKTGDLQALNEILRLGEVSVDLPSSSRGGWTALHLACFYDHPSVVESLLKAGANLEVRNDSGNTPLQLASLKGNIDIARILLESGADLYAESTDKGNALDYAQEWGGEDIVDFLLLWAAKSNYNL
ncbi:unnamed protein product [Calypogeia fissa]